MAYERTWSALALGGGIAGLTLLWGSYWFPFARPEAAVGANIGAGLLWFLALAVIAAAGTGLALCGAFRALSWWVVAPSLLILVAGSAAIVVIGSSQYSS